MKFQLEDLPVFFPYDFVYPEQYEYMLSVKNGVDNDAHCMLEMPSGTGKTISLLSVLVSYMKWKPSKLTKIIYCSRTVSEVEKAVEELKNLVRYVENETGEPFNVLGVALSSRKNMCINRSVVNRGPECDVDNNCRSLTASFVRSRHQVDDTVPVCSYFEEFDVHGRDNCLPCGIYNLEDLKEFGRQNRMCPYFLTRHSITHANIVVYSYYYLLDPKIANLVSKDLPKTSVVIFDEAHNIDNVCIESMSCVIRRNTISRAMDSLVTLQDTVKRTKEINKEKLTDEYTKLMNGLKLANVTRSEDLFSANPTLAPDIIDEAVPGEVRTAGHFLGFLRRFIHFIEIQLRTQVVLFKTPMKFLHDCKLESGIARHPLRFCSERLQSILHYLEIADLAAYQPLIQVATFATLVSTYLDGFCLIIEPFDERTPTIKDPILDFSCLDSSLAIKPVFARFNTVIITSGTLSPMEMYQNILDFRPGIKKSLTMSLVRNCVKPLIVTKGQDQMPLTTKFQCREDQSIIRNYGHLLHDLAEVVPDGIVCFFPSYFYLESTFTTWFTSSLLIEIQKHKLIFIETQDAAETRVALHKYKQACESGRGAILLCVARGKVSEGIDFAHHLGRCVIMFGIPFFYTQSRIIKARMAYLRERYKIVENDFINFDAMRHAAQCLGRVIRGKTDYGIMILADKRYNRSEKRNKLPAWIQSFIEDSHTNLSTEEAVQISKRFLREMGQPFDYEAQRNLAVQK